MKAAKNSKKQEESVVSDKGTPEDSGVMAEKSKKVFALFFCLVLFLVWKQTVADPYFFGNKPAANQGASETTAGVIGEAKTNGSQGLDSPSVEKLTGPSSTLQNSAISGQPTEVSSSVALTEYPSESEISAAGVLNVQTSSVLVKLSLLGGRVTEFRLKDYREENKDDSPALNLVNHEALKPYPLGVVNGAVNDARVSYQLVSTSFESVDGLEMSIAEGQKGNLVLKGTLPDGREVQKTLTFYGEGYFVDLHVQLSAPASDGAPVEVHWTKLIDEEESMLNPYDTSNFGWFDGEKAQQESFGEIEKNGMPLGDVLWLTIADKYFLTSLVAPKEAFKGECFKDGTFHRCSLEANGTSMALRLFSGPKSYNMLQDVGYELHRNLDFGWAGFVAAPLVQVLHIVYDTFGNYAVAIVLLTILVRALLFPLNAASFKQMKAMQEIQPEMKRIRETIKDKQAQQVELMGLYKKRGVNPLGGCLPMVLQMPIFIGLYMGLQLSVELRHAPFAFWISDLSAPERLDIAGMGIPVMVILMVMSMLVQQWMTPSTADPAQKKVMMIMPIVFGFMFAGFPAGLTLYWLTSNLISIAQQRTLQAKGARESIVVTSIVSLFLFLLTWGLSAVG